MNSLMLRGATALTCFAVAAPLAAQSRAFDIAAQPVMQGLTQIGKQADVQILVSADTARGKTGRAVRGQMPVEAAIANFIIGTGLAVQKTGPQTFSIVSQQAARSPLSTGGDLAAASDPSGDASAASGVEDIVVTGFRAALNNALNAKREQTAAIDSIVAEDIGKFPDSNLAESMQRIPGVALARGDGGEGRQISVRGLGPAFTRVRVNAMEAASRTGSSDLYGAGTSGRSFDFNAFPTEIFSALTVRKTPSADVEEGSLGATVDLLAPKPLAQREDMVVAATIRGVYGELAKDVTPRGSLLVSKKFGDDRWGVLGSIAYQKRHLREVGSQPGNIVSADTNGGFCSPLGFASINPALSAVRGTTATECSTGVPRTSNAAAYQAIVNARRADAPNTPGSGVFLPRTPRYMNAYQNQERIGGTATLQFQPDSQTDISLDLIYSRFHVVRDDNFIEGISFARSASNSGQPMSSVRDVQLSSLGSLQYGVFDGVDIRSEGLHEDFVSTFKQANLNFKHEFTDRLVLRGLFGINKSIYNDRERLQYQMDANNTPNFVIDNRSGIPQYSFGIDVSDINNFRYGPGLADGTVFGGFTNQGRPTRFVTKGLLGQVDAEWKIDDRFTLKAGGQFRENRYQVLGTGYYTADISTKALPAGITLASISRMITGVGSLWGHGAPDSWVALDPQKFVDTFQLDQARTCGVECGVGPARVEEAVSGAYAMGSFSFGDRDGFQIRGDAGVRYVHTEQRSSGYIAVAAPAGTVSPTGVVGQFNSASRTYDNWLPSANIVIQPTHDVLFRVSGAKVMARPELGLLIPTSSVNAVIRTGSVNNPGLDPIRANTFDVAAEWYFHTGALLSAAYFYKDIKTYVQNVSTLTPFLELGLPDALLAGSNTGRNELFDVARPLNTKGGPLKGFEVNAQLSFYFLGKPFSNFGVLANYTRVTSKIDYILTSSNGVPTSTTTADLVNLSKNTASGTLYYEDSRFSIRGTVNYRGRFLRQIPGNPGSNAFATDPMTFVDASASFNVTDRLKLILEGQNLTDEKLSLYIDTRRHDPQSITRVGRTITAGVNFRL